MAIRNLGKKVKIGIIQVDHVIEESMENKQNQLIDLAEKCLEEGAELVFFPEAFQYTGCREIKNDPEKLVAVSSAWKERCSQPCFGKRWYPSNSKENPSWYHKGISCY